MQQTLTQDKSASGTAQQSGPPDHLSKNEIQANAIGKPKWGRQNEQPLDSRGQDSTRVYAPLEALMSQYAQWLDYDPAQDAAEAAQAQQINHIFDEVNASRSKEMDDQYDSLQEDGAYFAMEEAKKWGAERGAGEAAIANNAKARQPEGFAKASRGGLWDGAGVGGDVGFANGLNGDLEAQGYSSSPKGVTALSYDDDELSSKLWNMEDPTDSAALSAAPVKGYAVFQDQSKQQVSVPQLGWGRSKPSVYKWTLEERETWWAHVEGTAAKQRSGSKGQNVWNNGGGGLGSQIGSALNGGKHMMGKQGKAEATGWDQYIQHFKVQPDGSSSDERHPDKALKQRKQQLEKLKAYYVDRAAYIAQYGSFLER